MPAAVPRPLVPEDVSPAMRNRSLVRAITAMAFAEKHGGNAGSILKQNWPRDPNAEYMLRAAAPPLDSTRYPGWTATSLFTDLAPTSAAMKLFARAMFLDLTGKHSIRVPTPKTRSKPIFVPEGNAAPVVQLVTTGTEVGPVRKILIQAALTGELEDATGETASSIIGNVLAHDAALSLDGIVFGAGAGDDVTPRGLLYGVAAQPASADTGIVGIAEDIGTLAETLATAMVDPSDMIIIAAARQAEVLKVLTGPHFDHPILSSLALPAGTIVGIAPGAIAWASDSGSAPTIQTSKQAVVHMEDAAPLPIVDGMPASPSASAFQTNSIVVKVRCAMTWSAIAPGVAMINNVAW